MHKKACLGALLSLCCAVIFCFLAGCSLARADMGAQAREDRLVGVFITTEYLDLFDFERYLSDNLSSFSGGRIDIDGDAREYQGRLYASLVSKTLTSETGESIETKEFVFEDIAGIPFFSAVVQTEFEYYTTSVSDEAISDGHINVYVGDDEDSRTMEATIYVVMSMQPPAESPIGTSMDMPAGTPDGPPPPVRFPMDRHVYYFNPVYQSADGSVYLMPGDGMSSSGTSFEGASFSKTMSATYTETENGKTKTESFSVQIAITTMYAPETIVILQFDENANLLSRTESPPGGLPDEISPELTAAFIVVETIKRDNDGMQSVSRDLYDRDAESIETFQARDDGTCVKRTTSLTARGEE